MRPPDPHALAEARAVAAMRWPYFGRGIYALVYLGETRDTPVAMVDRHWGLQLGPMFRQLPAVTRAAVLVHELLHLVREHHRRVPPLLAQDERRARLAADFEINDDLEGLVEGGVVEAAFRGLPLERIYERLPETAAAPSTAIAELLRQALDESSEGEGSDGTPSSAGSGSRESSGGSDGEGSGDESSEGSESSGGSGDESSGSSGSSEGSDGESSGGSGGSGGSGSSRSSESSDGESSEGSGDAGSSDPAATARAAAQELRRRLQAGESPLDGSADDGRETAAEREAWSRVGTEHQVGADQARRIVRAIQDAIRQHDEASWGSAPGQALRAWAAAGAGAERTPVRVSWQAVLSRLCRDVGRSRQAARDYGGWSRRRPPPIPGAYLRGLSCPRPWIAVVVDTSGSIDDARMAAMRRVVDTIRPHVEGIVLLPCDTEVQAVYVLRPSAPLPRRLPGGGGTDMGAGIAAAARMRRPRPALVVVLTDGETPWPEQRPRLPVAVLSPREPPSWAMWLRESEEEEER